MLWRDASVAWPGQMPLLVGTQDAWGPLLPGREDSGMVAFGFFCSSLPCPQYDIPPFYLVHVCEYGERLIARLIDFDFCPGLWLLKCPLFQLLE